MASLVHLLRLESVLLLLLSFPVSRAEIRDFRVLLEPDSAVVHYIQGYLIGPGAYINLEKLTFEAIDDPEELFLDDITDEDDDLDFEDDDLMKDDDTEVDEVDDGVDDTVDDGVDDTVDDGDDNPRRQLLADYTGLTELDVVVFRLPKACSNTRTGCDWTELGVGAKDSKGSVRWCCSSDAIDLGLCEEGSKRGSLILNDTLFDGKHRSLQIPAQGDYSTSLQHGKIDAPESGTYLAVFANCNDAGREMLVTGQTEWKSKHGYLPGDLFGFMYFYFFITLVYFGLMIAYGISMNINAESRIPIEKWIYMTVVMGLLETFCRSGDFVVWNAEGQHQTAAFYVAVFMGVLKGGISRVLLVMVSLGWGVTRDSLGHLLMKIVALGIFYVGTCAIRDFMAVIAIEDVHTITYEEDQKLIDVVNILTFAIFAVDVIFILWILDALNDTMEYLENMNQTRKLMRYLRLRCLFLFAVLFGVVWSVFKLVDTYDEEGILEEQHEWIVEAAAELNSLVVLIGVAVMWWPNPTAKEYAYVMELPGTNEDGEHELEMAGVVPSAADDDETDGKGENFEDEL